MTPLQTERDHPPSGQQAEGAGLAISLAQMREVYRIDDVVERARKCADLDLPLLKSTYVRMIERGPARFQVKPGNLPSMDSLYETLPNFHEVLDDVRRQLALCVDSGDVLEITPMLLLGPPGIGKTHFAQALAQLLGTGFGLVPMSSLTAGWILSGASSQWKGARPGKVFETLVDGQYSNAVLAIDEIDKARADGAYDPLGSLYSLLEHDTSRAFTDEFAEVPIDASQLVWVATANDDRSIPSPILNRMNVYEVKSPDASAARVIAVRLYVSLRERHEWGSRFEPQPREDVLDAMAQMPPREMRRAWMTGFGNAKLSNSDHIRVVDLPGRCTAGGARRSIGFMA